MKKIITIVSCFMALHSFAQIEGTWKLAPNAGSLAVGPNIGDGSWWSNGAGDVTTRACLFDDFRCYKDQSRSWTHLFA
jgi:hypothetical protein